MKTSPLDNRVVVITGGARGIGLSTAIALQGAGAMVVIGDVDEIAVKDAGIAAGVAMYGVLDVTDPASFSQFLDDVERSIGPIDVLINNAGIMPVGRFVDEPDSVTRRILAIDVYGVIVGSKLAAQRMLPRGRGHVINIASLAAESPTPGLATYCASKSAVAGLTSTLRREMQGTGVHFSAVLPTFTNTELVAGTRGARGIRNAEPEEIAEAICKLIRSPRSKVSVTRLAGAAVALQRLLPTRTSDALIRRFGLDKVFLDVDVEARRAYEARARGIDTSQ